MGKMVVTSTWCKFPVLSSFQSDLFVASPAQQLSWALFCKIGFRLAIYIKEQFLDELQ